MEFKVSNVYYAISKNGLDNVCERLEVVMSKSKTVTVPKYEVTPEVPAKMGTRIVTEAVPAQDAVLSADAVMGERHKVVETEEEITRTTTEIVKVDDKWVEKEISTTATETISTPQYEEVPLYDEDGKLKRTHHVPVMEEFEVSPAVIGKEAVEAEEEVTEEYEIEPAVPAVTSTIKTYLVERRHLVNLTDPDPDDFITYGDITEEVAIEWAKEELGSERLELIEASLDADIENQENPPAPTSGSGKPWA